MSNLNLRRLHWLAPAALALGLSGCVSSTAPAYRDQVTKQAKPKPAPQVVYRIDDHRYFEVTPENDCYDDMLSFVDTARGIRSDVVKFDAVMNRTTLIIDAANDQYLVAPVTRGGTNCSSGGGACGGSKMPYSTDGGRTWQMVWSPGNDDDLLLSGSIAYQSRYRPAYGSASTEALDLTIPRPRSSDWQSISKLAFKPRIAPSDTKVWCSTKPEGSK